MNNDMDLTRDVYPRFETLKFVTKLAGGLGVVQSIIWIALSVLGIVAYFGVLNFSHDGDNINSVTGLLFYELYFKGPSDTSEYRNLDINNVLRDRSSLSPNIVIIIVWIYLILNFFWFCTSASILNNINENHLRRTNVLLYVWVFNTLAISALDLGVGIVFGLEFDAFVGQSKNIDSGARQALLLEAALVVTISIVIVALRGFILWILNVSLAIYFFMETFAINEFATSRVSLVSRDVISDTHSIITKTPISAYDAQNPYREQPPLRINTDALERANKMSIIGLKERFANRQTPERFREYSRKWEPDPDYTPPMPRSNKFYGDDGTRF